MPGLVHREDSLGFRLAGDCSKVKLAHWRMADFDFDLNLDFGHFLVLPGVVQEELCLHLWMLVVELHLKLELAPLALVLDLPVQRRQLARYSNSENLHVSGSRPEVAQATKVLGYTEGPEPETWAP